MCFEEYVKYFSEEAPVYKSFLALERRKMNKTKAERLRDEIRIGMVMVGIGICFRVQGCHTETWPPDLRDSFTSFLLCKD